MSFFAVRGCSLIYALFFFCSVFLVLRNLVFQFFSNGTSSCRLCVRFFLFLYFSEKFCNAKLLSVLIQYLQCQNRLVFSIRGFGRFFFPNFWLVGLTVECFLDGLITVHVSPCNSKDTV